MSRKTSALIAVLLCVIGIQGWLLHETKTPADKTGVKTGDIPVSAIANENRDPAFSQNDMSNHLARIDARLSALETTKRGATNTQQQEIILGSAEALAADRKISALLPDGPLTQQELFLFQSQLAQYPSGEKAQLSAALARAINNGQVQISSGNQ